MIKKELPIKPIYSDEVLIEVQACGICGSDRREFQNGRFFWKKPEAGGHELVGKVIQIGKNCKKVREDDIVCYRIPRQHTGITQFGGFSKYVVIREECLYILPSNIDKCIATMIEPLACAVHIRKMIGDEKRIAIIGSGTIAILLEKYLNTEFKDKDIYLIYKHEAVKNLVSRKTHCISFQKIESCGVFEVPYKFDTVIECTGNAAEFAKMWNLIDTEGRMILSGIYNDSLIANNNGLSLSTMMFHENKIQGSFLYTEADFNEAAELIISETIKVDDLITKMSFEKCQEAFELPSDKRVKVVLVN